MSLLPFFYKVNDEIKELGIVLLERCLYIQVNLHIDSCIVYIAYNGVTPDDFSSLLYSPFFLKAYL